MHTSKRFQRSTAARFRGLSLAGLLFHAAALPAFAAEADLALVVTAAPAPVVVDGELRFSLDVVNRGPDSAEDVTVEIDLPAEVSLVAASTTRGVCQPGPPLICRLGQVGAAAPDNRVGVTVDTVTDGVADISLAAAVASRTADPLPDDNAATAALSIVAASDSADLSLDLRPAVAVTGHGSRFEVIVANDGPALAAAVEVRVEIPELTMASYWLAYSSQGVCSSALDTCAGPQCQEILDQPLAVSCDLGGMATDGRAAVTLDAGIDLPVGAQITVSAEVAARDTADADPANNSISVAVTVIDIPEFGVLPISDQPLIGDVGGIGPGCFLQAVLW